MKKKSEVVAEEKSEEVVAEAPKKGKVSSITVTWNGGERVYSKEIHGDEFEALAKEFAEKHKGIIA